MYSIIRGIPFIGLLVLASGRSQGQNQERASLKDTLDNAFDLSYYLYDLHGFLPVVSPITEPAVGFGAALAGT